MKKVILETDLGHDPDDFFTICFLSALGVKIDAITLTPGDIDQLAMAHLLVDRLQLNCPVGVSKLNRDKKSSDCFVAANIKEDEFWQYMYNFGWQPT